MEDDNFVKIFNIRNKMYGRREFIILRASGYGKIKEILINFFQQSKKNNLNTLINWNST